MLTLNPTAEKALKLLGNGVPPESVANALGVTPSYISQLVSDENFAAEVAELRFVNLQKHNEIDSSYDTMEKTLLDKMEDLIPLMLKPMEVLRAIQVINGAKRRGSSAPESIINKTTQINLVLPVQIVNKFTSNANNQIISVGDQELLTIDSKTLESKVRKSDDVINSNTRKEIAGVTIDS